MKTRNKIIICLIFFGLIILGIVKGIVIPKMAQNDQRYITEQQDPVTHDFKSVLKYKNKYMGNASNIINLFNSLPLNNIEKWYGSKMSSLAEEMVWKKTVQSRLDDNKYVLNCIETVFQKG